MTKFEKMRSEEAQNWVKMYSSTTTAMGNPCRVVRKT